MRPIAPILLALLLVVPTASAHVGDGTGVYSVEADGLVVILRSQSLVVKATRDEVFNGTILEGASGKYETVRNATVSIEAAGPGEAQVETISMELGFQTRIRFPAPGDWTLYVQVGDALRTLSLHVYPPSDAWLEAGDLRANFHYVNKTLRETLYIRSESTNKLLVPSEPAQGLLERWENETATPLDMVTLPVGSMGGIVFERTFSEQGSFLLTVSAASLGLPSGALAPVLFKIGPPFTGMGEGPRNDLNQTPTVGFVGLVVIAAALALARRK